MLTSTRRRLAAGAMVLLVPALGGCGFGYQTDQIYQPGVGVNHRDGQVDVLGAVVVSGTEGEGTFVASMVNKDTENDDALQQVTGEGVEVQLQAPIEIPSDTLVNLADTGAIGITGESVTEGTWVRLTLTFESGETAEINAPVVPDDNEFSEVELAEPSTAPTP
jgi:hypothetical protein